MANRCLYRKTEHAGVPLGRDKARPARMGGRHASGGDDDKQCIRGTRGGVQESRLCPRRYAFSGLDERDVLLFVVVDNHTEGLVYVPGQPRLLKKPARLFAPSRQADRRED